MKVIFEHSYVVMTVFYALLSYFILYGTVITVSIMAKKMFSWNCDASWLDAHCLERISLDDELKCLDESGPLVYV